ncbi:ABC transporter ATP-binding protein [Paraclostridium sordellii]|uniref:ABC transporter ATP-binding protein n=1 Tax=Paraclostridium sordellii TaxID=1505 RepID=A0A0C7PJK3_PARSO|nr:ABC transporter ATP-binding protein [Paeniclostridium sordellii]QYE97164.1 ABC transporter ATP-binding protein/permease [Paeniclostridium sordellii]CEN21383.1 ABC transporter ATP-binding protein [[Clostridium] sordellii] [Paeniclostridium sordellii]CEN79175.1 ABC transporter ATP-binding protein [[Clostridium] sordellii] [Paeniclostridium sordellii]CEP88377.1 ABC transporter ATP-binding protein [[Clostridium] sordellii] [Paeniclostridium sordellii]CEP97010.1 ABC transporter ATP-binding prote
MLKLLKNLKKYKWVVVIIFLLVFIQALCDVYLPNLMSNIVDIGIINNDKAYILKIGFIMLGVSLIGVIATILASYFGAKVAMGFGRDIREKVFEQVETFSLKEVNDLGVSSLITRTTNDVTQIQQVLIIMLRMMLYAPMVAIGATIMAIRKDSKLSLIILVSIPILILSIYLIASKAIPLFKKMQKNVDKLNRVLRENLTGIRVIRVFNKYELEKQKFEKSSFQLSDIAIKANRIITLLMPIMMLLVNLSIIAVVWFGGIRIDRGNMQVGDLIAFIQYLTQIMFALMMLSMMFVMVPRASASADRINEILGKKSAIYSKENAIKETEKTGYLEFKNISFYYDENSEKVLDNINFKSGPGETTAIIGGTGSGKSTLVKLIPRLFEANEGEVLVDGINVKDMDLKVLRDKIGYVPQKSVLFTGTIKENIVYSDDDASNGDIKSAIDISQSKEFINEKKDRENSYIAQGGNNVSGGQKQRLAIARAIVKKPEIYIFDDSFSALDFKTDKKLREALKEETKKSTVIIVAQRVSTVINADRIIVLDEGKVIKIGTHKELLETCDIYKEIVYSQLSKEEI